MRPPPPAITRLSDEFGQFTVIITCKRCGHERKSEPLALARLVGWSAQLSDIAARMRCSSCNHKQVRVEARRPPRRSWMVDIKRD